MKNKLFLLFLGVFAFLNVSCATTSTNSTKYNNISISEIRNNCQVVETWTFHVMGAGITAGQFDNCLGVDNLVSMAVDTEAYTETVRRQTLDLLALHYQLYLKNQVDGTKLWTVVKVKEEVVDGWLTYFYEVTSKDLDCSGGACRIED
tara:strand:- start:50 stop:493 length:444 start_codon:yes stop_codon:yes gene_type:complete